MSAELEQGIFRGKVIQKLDDLAQSMDTMQEDLRLFKREAYGRINKNSLDIARSKSWMGVIALVAGIAGGFLRGLIFRR